MADDEEVALKKEIEFLTNLINGVSSAQSGGSHHGRSSVTTTKRSHPWPSTTRTQHSIYKSKPENRSKYAWVQPSQSRTKPSSSHTQPSFSGPRVTSEPSYSGARPSTTEQRTNVRRGQGAGSKTTITTTQRPSSFKIDKISSKTLTAQAYTSTSTTKNQSTTWSSQGKCTRYSLSKEREKGASSSFSNRVVKLPGAKVETKPPSSAGETRSVARTIVNTQKVGNGGCQTKLVKSTKGTMATAKTSRPEPASPTRVSTQDHPAEKRSILASPTVIRAGKKIIEEIERLNKAVALLDRASQKSSLLNRSESVVHTGVPKPPKRQVLPQSSSAPCLQSLDIRNKGKTSEHVPSKRTVIGSEDSDARQHSMKVQASSAEGNSLSDQAGHKKAIPNRYKLVRTVQPQDPLMPSPTKIQPSPLSPALSRKAPTPAASSPSRRVYLTKRKLENSRESLPPAKVRPLNSPTAIMSDPLKTDHRPKPKIKRTPTSEGSPSPTTESGDMKSLLRELSIIDTAFRTAKLQSSQKLIKRALATKQKVNQRKSGEKRRVTTPVRSYRYSQTKWSSSVGRRQQSKAKSPVKGTKSWKSRFSLKKSVSDTDLNINQLLGRDVKNVSSSKYKFINARTPAHQSPKKYQGRASGQRGKKRSLPASNSLKVDRRTPQQKAASSGRGAMRTGRGQRLVSIGGLVYKTSHRKLIRTPSTHCKVFARKGLSKLQSRTVTVQGRKYRATRNGLSLRREDSSKTTGKDDVRRLSLGGVKYVQTRPGTLVRADHTASRTTASRFIYRSIAVAAAANRNRKISKAGRTYCMFYNRFGKCNRGDKCPYIHDPEKIAVCTRFLRGTCGVTDCPFSHQVAPEKMAVCTRYLRGVCSRDECPYRHVNVGLHAQPCQDFLKGYCPRGNKCKKKHSRVCPDHNGQGSCEKGAACRLHHPTRRGEKRSPDTDSPDPTTRKDVQKMARLSSVYEEDTGGDDDLDLPMAKRHLPAYIALYSEEDVSMPPPTPGDEPLQIRPNLSFDAS